jgi:adenylosuccinate lyase
MNRDTIARIQNALELTAAILHKLNLEIFDLNDTHDIDQTRVRKVSDNLQELEEIIDSLEQFT